MKYESRLGTKQPKKPQPHTWTTGPDPRRHAMFNIFLQARNQANYRKEQWDLTFEQYEIIWNEKFDLRGRKKGQFCMSKTDPSLSWAVDNVFIGERGDVLRHFKVVTAKGKKDDD